MYKSTVTASRGRMEHSPCFLHFTGNSQYPVAMFCLCNRSDTDRHGKWLPIKEFLFQSWVSMTLYHGELWAVYSPTLELAAICHGQWHHSHCTDSENATGYWPICEQRQELDSEDDSIMHVVPSCAHTSFYIHLDIQMQKTLDGLGMYILIIGHWQTVFFIITQMFRWHHIHFPHCTSTANPPVLLQD